MKTMNRKILLPDVLARVKRHQTDVTFFLVLICIYEYYALFLSSSQANEYFVIYFA